MLAKPAEQILFRQKEQQSIVVLGVLVCLKLLLLLPEIKKEESIQKYQTYLGAKRRILAEMVLTA